ncbi:MAG: hypothetical protein Q9159_004020 [Coniocarpon cinnabarinum]
MPAIGKLPFEIDLEQGNAGNASHSALHAKEWSDGNADASSLDSLSSASLEGTGPYEKTSASLQKPAQESVIANIFQIHVRRHNSPGFVLPLKPDSKRYRRCIGVRLSTRPLLESHAFATIPAERSERGFSCVISNAGDWTKGIIREPGERTKIWMKGAPVYGVLRTALIFKRTVIVATGSGIGPCLSLLNDNDDIDCRILWSTKAPVATYGPRIVNAVRYADPNAVILDSGKMGRPNMVALTYQLYRESGAEAVFLISNPIVTRKVIYGLEARGVPAFAPIFDS